MAYSVAHAGFESSFVCEEVVWEGLYRHHQHHEEKTNGYLHSPPGKDKRQNGISNEAVKHSRMEPFLISGFGFLCHCDMS